jgi:hypothetical protein
MKEAKGFDLLNTVIDVYSNREPNIVSKIPVGARFSAPVHTGSAIYLASCTIGTRFFSRGLTDGAWH